MECSSGSLGSCGTLHLQTSLVTSIKYKGGTWREKDGPQVSSWECVGIYPLGSVQRYGFKRNQWKGLSRSEKSWKAILLRELEEIGVLQLNKENAEMPKCRKSVSEVLQARGPQVCVTTSCPSNAESRVSSLPYLPKQSLPKLQRKTIPIPAFS